jgi:hypothetical protein
MTSTLQDEICPGYIGTELITISLALPDIEPRSFQYVLLNVDYSATDEIGGIVLPLELMVTAPTISNFRRTIFDLVATPQLSFQPQEAGEHLIVLREVAHNRVYGKLLIQVAGEKADPLLAVPRPIP